MNFIPYTDSRATYTNLKTSFGPPRSFRTQSVIDFIPSLRLKLCSVLPANRTSGGTHGRTPDPAVFSLNRSEGEL